MAEMITTPSAMEKLNDNNYSTWSFRMTYYLQGQELWEIVGGGETASPSADKVEECKKWKTKAGKAMYVLTIAIEDGLLHKVKEAKTPKEIWDTLKALYEKTNDAKLQRLENELMAIKQDSMGIGEYFSKVKALCKEISKLDRENPITDTRTRRIIIHGIRPEFNSLVTATRGWAKEPTLEELENILANQEALDRQLSAGGVKEEDTALFTNNRGARRNENIAKKDESGRSKGQQSRWSKNRSWRNSQEGGARGQHNKGGRNEQRNQRQNVRCYNCGKNGHYARDCWHNQEEGNIATSSSAKNEETWDIHALSSFEETAYYAAEEKEINYDSDRIVDSGCSNHMTGNLEKL